MIILLWITSFGVGAIRTPNTAEKSKYPWTELDEYVWRPDDNFKWSVISEEDYTDPDGDGTAKFVVLNVTTQAWLTPETFTKHNCHIWWHYVHLIIPDHFNDENNPLRESAFVMVGQGNYENDPATPEEEKTKYALKVALSTNSVAVSIRNVPFQPCKFAEDKRNKRKVEDALIAFTRAVFINYAGKKFFLSKLKNAMIRLF